MTEPYLLPIREFQKNTIISSKSEAYSIVNSMFEYVSETLPDFVEPHVFNYSFVEWCKVTTRLNILQLYSKQRRAIITKEEEEVNELSSLITLLVKHSTLDPKVQLS